MSAPAADAGEAPKGGKKKLIMIIGIVVVLLIVGGAAAFFLLKKPPPAEGEEGEEGAAAATHAPAKKDEKKKEKKKDEHPPAFVPLDPFTVNLADRDKDRYAQIAITLQIEDAHEEGQIKNYMPAIRNQILMVLAGKTSEDLLSREGKEHLAEELRKAASRGMGIEMEDEDEHADPKKKKKKKVEVESPIVAVHFSNFIVQ